MATIEMIKPADIEKRSFEIIEETIKARNISVPFLMGNDGNEVNIKCKAGDPVLCRAITYRCIHTTADFDYAESLRFSENAVDIIKRCVAAGALIITDTNMALTGINKKKLAEHNGEIYCFMADPEVAEKAKSNGTTRAYEAMKKAYGLHKENASKPVIFAIGNAPTALISLHKLYCEEGFRPDLIIGVPVGFVNVVVSKELIMQTDIPYIINEGNKGGSAVAAAIVNAVLYSFDK
ncbi:MAG: precorrin-8X methylmutase [Lachnospiraceae bacterium]|nr:precorrin-8X methylmutase [Lachnospiraceae bacterium]